MNSTKRLNLNGYVLHETKHRVVIATGFTRKSANEKTGDMIQIWILHRTINPLDAIKSGADKTICGNCKHRGTLRLTDEMPTNIGRRCYVQVDKAPNGIWKAYQRGRYRKARRSQYAALFANRNVRFGAYGDPAFIPLSILEAIAKACNDWTGYTHQWENEKHRAYRAYIMASADSEAEARTAQAQQWRTFRVRGIGAPMLPNEIMCPASAEANHRATCAQCRLCNGKKHGANDPRKNIVIIDHSRIAKSQPLIQIGEEPR